MGALLFSFSWGIWHGLQHSGIMEVILTSAVIAAGFMFLNRDALNMRTGETGAVEADRLRC